ncbi:hypothetical protein RVR_9282 [Actinacidiphila reveromycinica]|uniref:Uncharacterized protein n=1 Tax=Actinacidiphila reveromycinica TaxID=659352 RepID=A0A7U3VSC4_9ACTN|nr:hypothetical protein [Streptomyces sp. SN-593]BBB01736.1 hypothetical protein RVR_9282 [Streptomyces sp. SN-593]
MDADSGAQVIVEPPTPGGRRIRVGRESLGLARGPADLLEFLRRAGLDPDTVSLDDPDLFVWHGGGPDVWTAQEGS